MGTKIRKKTSAKVYSLSGQPVHKNDLRPNEISEKKELLYSDKAYSSQLDKECKYL